MDKTNLDFEDIRAALDGNAILFIGAGFAANSQNILGESLPLGSTLRRKLAEDLAIEDNYSLDVVTDYYVSNKGVYGLYNLLKNILTVNSTSSAQKVISSLKWRHVYTTNYDNSYQVAAHPITVETINPKDKIAPHGSNHVQVIHLNGCLDRATEIDLLDQLILTDSSYTEDRLNGTRWFNTIRLDIEMAPAIYFVGYSLADIDIKRLLYTLQHLRHKIFFVCGKNIDKVQLGTLEKYGKVLNADLQDFAHAIEEYSKAYEPPPAIELGYAFEQSSYELSSAYSDEDVNDFFALGKTLKTSPLDLKSPVIQRDVAQNVIEGIKRGAFCSIVYGGLGNGKSTILSQIELELISQGYSVYRLLNSGEHVGKELLKMSQNGARSILIIDDYAEWIKDILYINSRAFEKLQLVLSDRTIAHELVFDRLASDIELAKISEYNCDQLSNDEVDCMIRVMDLYGLWGQRAGQSPGLKRKFIERDCNRQMHAVLLGIFEAPQIRDRIVQIVEKIRKKESFYECFIVLSISAYLQFPVNISVLGLLVGDLLYNASLQKDKLLSEVVDFRHGEIKLRSSVTAEHILKSACGDNDIIDIIISILKKISLANDGRDNHVYWEMRKKLVMFKNIERLLNGEDKLASVLGYYERMKFIGNTANNAHFWLQYAIAATTYLQLDRANKYFDVAISKCQYGDEISIAQINNHYARFLLEKATERSDSDHYRYFVRARDIINSQLREKASHIKFKYYPYKCATSYADYYDSKRNLLSPEQSTAIRNASQFVLNSIERLPHDEQRGYFVREAKKQLSYVVSEIEKTETAKPSPDIKD